MGIFNRWPVTVEIQQERQNGTFIFLDKGRREIKEGREHYKLKKLKHTFPAQPFKNIVNSNKGPYLKIFSPQPGVYYAVKNIPKVKKEGSGEEIEPEKATYYPVKHVDRKLLKKADGSAVSEEEALYVADAKDWAIDRALRAIALHSPGGFLAKWGFALMMLIGIVLLGFAWMVSTSNIVDLGPALTQTSSNLLEASRLLGQTSQNLGAVGGNIPAPPY